MNSAHSLSLFSLSPPPFTPPSTHTHKVQFRLGKMWKTGRVRKAYSDTCDIQFSGNRTQKSVPYNQVGVALNLPF